MIGLRLCGILGHPWRIRTFGTIVWVLASSLTNSSSTGIPISPFPFKRILSVPVYNIFYKISMQKSRLDIELLYFEVYASSYAHQRSDGCHLHYQGKYFVIRKSTGASIWCWLLLFNLFSHFFTWAGFGSTFGCLSSFDWILTIYLANLFLNRICKQARCLAIYRRKMVYLDVCGENFGSSFVECSTTDMLTLPILRRDIDNLSNILPWEWNWHLHQTDCHEMVQTTRRNMWEW